MVSPTTSSNLSGISLCLALIVPAVGSAANILIVEPAAVRPNQHLKPSEATNKFPQSNIATPKTFLHALAVRPLIDQLKKSSALSDGWDGNGSTAPASDAISAALGFISSMPPSTILPDVSLAGDGEISISWRDAEKFIDISFYGRSATVFSRINGQVVKLNSVQRFSELPVLAVEALLVS